MGGEDGERVVVRGFSFFLYTNDHKSTSNGRDTEGKSLEGGVRCPMKEAAIPGVTPLTPELETGRLQATTTTHGEVFV
jgi:hypothetical protein